LNLTAETIFRAGKWNRKHKSALTIRLKLYQFPFDVLHIDPPTPLSQGGARKASVASIYEIGITGFFLKCDR
jgi:hypothetical protein